MRDGSTNIFTVRRKKNPEVYPIKAIDLYVAFAKGIPMGSFIQFRPTSPGGEIVDKSFSYSAADSRFKEATLPKWEHFTASGRAAQSLSPL